MHVWAGAQLARTQRVIHSDGAALIMSSFCGGPRSPPFKASGYSGLSVSNARAGRRPAAVLAEGRGPACIPSRRWVRGSPASRERQKEELRSGSGRVARSGCLNHQRVVTARIYVPVRGLSGSCAGSRAPRTEASAGGVPVPKCWRFWRPSGDQRPQGVTFLRDRRRAGGLREARVPGQKQDPFDRRAMAKKEPASPSVARW